MNEIGKAKKRKKVNYDTSYLRGFSNSGTVQCTVISLCRRPLPAGNTVRILPLPRLTLFSVWVNGPFMPNSSASSKMLNHS